MAISRDVSQDAANSNGSATSLAATFAATATANKFLVSGGAFTTPFANVTPPAGWSQAFALDHNSGGFCLACYYKVAAGTETGATWATSSAVAIRIAAYQYSGIATASPLDKVATAQSGASSVTSLATGTTALTTVADELIITCCTIDGAGVAFNWANAQAKLRDDQLFSFAQRIVAATGTYSDTPSWTNSLHAVSGIATFKAAAAADTYLTGWQTC